MNDEKMAAFVKRLMMREIARSWMKELSYNEACAFASKVIDRFSNPFLEHKWISISMNYTSKMKMRNVPLLLRHSDKTGKVRRAWFWDFRRIFCL